MTDDFLLTAEEMQRVNRRLDQRTGGRLQLGPQPVLNSQAKAVWEASRAFIVRKAAVVPVRRSRAPSVGLALGGAAMSLSGCAMLNPNVKGSFDCRAPNGTCSPTTSIDNRALADIASGSAGVVEPIGTYEVPVQEPRIQTASLRKTSTRRSPGDSVVQPLPGAEPARSNERVLRIVFPAHVDRQGRFVEASAVHTVVERGAWLSAEAAGAAAPVRLSERPSLTEFASAAPEFSFADLDGSRPGVSAEAEDVDLASAPPSPRPSGAVSARALPPGAPKLAQPAPGGLSSTAAAASAASTIPVSVRGQLQALKPIVVTPVPATGHQPVTKPGNSASTLPASELRSSDLSARNLSPANASLSDAAGDLPRPTQTASRPPLMQTAPASAGAVVQAGVASKLDDMRAGATAAAKDAIASKQPANPPAHFSAWGVDK